MELEDLSCQQAKHSIAPRFHTKPKKQPTVQFWGQSTPAHHIIKSKNKIKIYTEFINIVCLSLAVKNVVILVVGETQSTPFRYNSKICSNHKEVFQKCRATLVEPFTGSFVTQTYT